MSMTEAAAFERRVFELTNQERAKRGLKPLMWDGRLAASAFKHSEDMALHSYFGHKSRNGAMPKDRIELSGFEFSYCAENIAAGQRSPERVVEAWMDSPVHRDNILSERAAHLGVGLYCPPRAGSRQTGYGFYWTQHFAAL